MTSDLVERLFRRAEIRRQILTRKSVINEEPDRIADLLEEAALEIRVLQSQVMALSTALDISKNDYDKFRKPH